MAEFTRDHFAKEIVKLSSFRSKDYGKALREMFMQIDDMLETKEGIEKLKTYITNKGRDRQDSIGYAAGATACVAILADN